MTKIYYEKDSNLEPLKSVSVGIIGYGNQGRAHALNLKDSGVSVQVGSREGGVARDNSLQDGFAEHSIEDVATNCDVLSIMLPDQSLPSIYRQSIEPYISGHKTFVFAHGFAVHHKSIAFPENADIVLVAPTGPGRQLRSLYEKGLGLPSLLAVEQDASGSAWETCLAYALAIGSLRVGAIETTFKEETIVDLYCEQAVLCGGLPALIRASFDTLVNAGYQPELAYISCLKEVKLIADLLFEQGIDGMRSAISTTAQFGSAIAGQEIIDTNTERRLGRILERIESGEFAKIFANDYQAGNRTIKEFNLEERHSRLARTGKELKEKLLF